MKHFELSLPHSHVTKKGKNSGQPQQLNGDEVVVEVGGPYNGPPPHAVHYDDDDEIDGDEEDGDNDPDYAYEMV